MNAPSGVPLANPNDFYPFVQTPMWIKLLSISTNAREIVDFLIAHLNPQNGRFDAWPSVPSIAAFIGRGDRTVQNIIRDELEPNGVVEVVDVYDDNLTGERTTSATDANGRNNGQSMNSYRPRFTPTEGMLHPGPINLAEFYDLRKKTPKGLINKRIANEQARRNRTPVQSVTPGYEQEKQANQQVTPPRSELHPPGATHYTAPVQPVAPKEEQPEGNQPEVQEPSLRSGSLWVAKAPSVPSRNASAGDETATASPTGQHADDGRTDGTGHPIATNPSKNRGKAWDQADWPALLREDEVYDALTGKPGFKRSQVAQLAKFVARSIHDHGEPAVRGYLLDVASIAAKTTFVFDAFSAERWNDPQDVEEVERWDVRQAKAVEAEAQRQQEQARINQTRAKQQRAYEAELDRRQADQLAPRRQREQAPEPDQPSQVSPVFWLSVDQFEKLSPQDKACVRAHGNTPEDQLKKLPAKQIARIKATMEGVAA